jgi:pyruvate/2-oxoglutarate dehydrogenase complex dihydrolipoamide acyltransferase (E2) component
VEVEQLDSLGDSITTAVLLNWAKLPGDAVHEDDVIAVVETDKVKYNIQYYSLT